MNSKEFLSKIIEVGVSYSRKIEKKNFGTYTYFEVQSPKKDKKTGKIKNPPTLDDYLHLEWVTGGVSGGSCWDDGTSHHYAKKGEAEPEFAALDDLLLELCPNITFLQYRKLTNDIIEFTDREINEYYGNSTAYGIKTIRLGALFDKLQELKLI